MALTATSPSGSVPASVKVAAGATTATFTVTALATKHPDPPTNFAPDLPARTAERLWAYARAWLRRALGGP